IGHTALLFLTGSDDSVPPAQRDRGSTGDRRHITRTFVPAITPTAAPAGRVPRRGAHPRPGAARVHRHGVGQPVCIPAGGSLYSRPRTGNGGTAGCPSGQWEQTVNLSVKAYVGSNPTPATPSADEPRKREIAAGLF